MVVVVAVVVVAAVEEFNELKPYGSGFLESLYVVICIL